MKLNYQQFCISKLSEQEKTFVDQNPAIKLHLIYGVRNGVGHLQKMIKIVKT
jgi:hypothetical protein